MRDIFDKFTPVKFFKGMFQTCCHGSVESKTTKVTSTPQVVEEVVTNHYNLAGRLDKVTTDKQSGTENVVEYIYNDDSIRVRAYSYTQPTGGGTKTGEKTVIYLVDSYNHTGYAQALEELTYNKANPVIGSDTPDSVRTYLIGDDVLAQTVDGVTDYLLYDGHGSTRQLAEYSAGAVSVADSYSYDGYGVLLQNESDVSANPGKVAPQQTSLLYTGEHFDTDAQQYYLRARYYDPLNGRFNQMDPFAGSPQDPQSLHKYLYCHANPVNNIDPTGNFSVGAIAIIALKVAISLAVFYTFYSIGNIGKRLFGGNTLKQAITDWDADTNSWAVPVRIKVNGEVKWVFNSGNFIKEYANLIKASATAEAIPAAMLAGVLLMEMRKYAVIDFLFDSWSPDNSIGPAQIEPNDLKRWVPSKYGGKSIKELQDILMDPQTAIPALAQCIKYFSTLSSGQSILPNYYSSNNNTDRAHWSGMMSGLKDVADEGQFIPSEHAEWIEGGAKSYLKAIKIAPGLME